MSLKALICSILSWNIWALLFFFVVGDKDAFPDLVSCSSPARSSSVVDAGLLLVAVHVLVAGSGKADDGSTMTEESTSHFFR
jgi:hypothetical protein